MLGKRYLVPRGDGLTLIGSTEEPEVGFEKRTTAEGIAGLLAFAWATVPTLAGASLEAVVGRVAARVAGRAAVHRPGAGVG